MSETQQRTRGLLEAEITRVQTAIEAYHANAPTQPRSVLLDEILRNANAALASGDAVAMFNALQELGECR